MQTYKKKADDYNELAFIAEQKEQRIKDLEEQNLQL